MEYRLVAFMVNELPMDQLAEIEANSHVRLVTTLWPDKHSCDSTSGKKQTGFGSFIS